MSLGSYVAISLAVVLTACAPQTQPPARLIPGGPLEPGPSETAEACEARLRADIGGSVSIRTAIARTVDAFDAGRDAAVFAAVFAADDPNADLATIGTPITQDELRLIEQSGLELDALKPLGYWVYSGAPDRFGGFWIDPPGSDRHVVAIADPDVLPLARCLQPNGRPLRYVTAGWSIDDIVAVRQRIGQDWEDKRLDHLQIVSIGEGVRSDAWVIIVGVAGSADEARQELIATYGEAIVVETTTYP